MRIQLDTGAAPYDFDVAQDDFATLVVRPSGDENPLYYFYDPSRSKLIKDFVLGETTRTKVVCRVTLVRGSNGRLSPRLAFSVRSTAKKDIVSESVAVTEGEIRSIKASVDLRKHYENFWKLIQYLSAFPDIDVGPESYKAVAKSDAEVLDQVKPVVAALREGTVQPGDTVDLIEAIFSQPEAVTAVKRAGGGALLRSVVQRSELRDIIEELSGLVLDSATTEPQLQTLLEGNWWIFGGRFIDKARRRSLTVRDQLDIPLIQTDGSLHVIELKKAAVPKLVVPYRSHYVVGTEINNAVGQTMNYLRSLDENCAQILADLKIDVRRARVTVVVGHPTHCDGVEESEVRETIRGYNSHLSRVEVLTYEDLIAGARRTLDINETSDGSD